MIVIVSAQIQSRLDSRMTHHSQAFNYFGKTWTRGIALTKVYENE